MEDMGVDSSDDFAAAALWGGWFDEDVSPDERHDFREAFFDWMDFDYEDFPWDDWREWYGEAA